MSTIHLSTLFTTLRALALAALALLSAPAAAPVATQVVGGSAAITLRNPCDGRIDVTRLPASGSSRHVITASGSYFLGRNIQCDAGQTAIEIAPGAGHVVIDGNGFAILGDPGRTSPHAVHSPPSPAARASLHLVALSAHGFSGDILRVEDVDECRVLGGVLTDGDGNGFAMRRRGDVILEDISCSSVAGRAVDVEDVSSVSLRRCLLTQCGSAVRACSASLKVLECDVRDMAADGLVFDDLCSGVPLAPGFRKSVSSVETTYNVCSNVGIRVATSGPHPIDLSLSINNLGSTGKDGVEVTLPPLPGTHHRVSIEGGSVEGSGGNGLDISGGAATVVVSSVDIGSTGLDGVRVHGASASSPSSVTLESCNIGSSGCDGVDVRHAVVQMDRVSISGAQEAGLRADECSVSCTSVDIGSSGLDGVDLQLSSLKMYQSSVQGSAGVGIHMRSANEGFFDRVAVCGNGGGGLRVDAASGCATTTTRLSACSFVSNGGVALDLQSARGGEVRACTVTDSSTGIRLGDGSGLSCSSAVRVTDSSVTHCGSGIEVLDGGGHLVVRNYVAQCLSSFSVTPGNLLGPVISTDMDMATSSNPHSNYAP